MIQLSIILILFIIYYLLFNYLIIYYWMLLKNRCWDVDMNDDGKNKIFR